MSGNSFVGYGLALVAGIVAGFAAPGVGFSLLWGLGAFSIAASILVRPPIPTDYNKPTDYGNAGRVANTRQAAAENLNINSATEAVVIPVVFGTCRLNGNHIGYQESSFRSVPIIERQQRSPQFVAYQVAKETFENSPSIVDHELDMQARKNGGGGGKGGGKGGRGKTPPPSQSYSDADKVNAYTQLLLENDESGKSRLPKEYDEFVAGFNYYLSFEIGICCGEVTALHGVLSYPQEKYVIDRRADPYILTDDTAMVAAGPTEGGNVRFYRGSGTQERNLSDPYAADYNNYRGTCFAVFEDYKMGNQPAPNSFVFEVERIPVCLDEDGDEIAGFQTRAGDDTTPVDVTAISWETNVVTVTAPGHGYAPGDVIFHANFEPDGWNGQLTVSTVDGDDYTAQFITEPESATKFGEVQGPPQGDPDDLVSATWSEGRATFNFPDHGAQVDQLVEITGFTPSDWNGTWRTVAVDGATFSVLMPGNPGTATILGDFRLYPMPSEITAANWNDGVVTFSASNDFQDGDPVIVTGMEPPIYNGSFTVLDGDSGSFDAVLTSPPAPASVMGTVTGPTTESALDVSFVVWSAGIVTFNMADAYDGYNVGDRILVEGFTPAGYNGTYEITRVDGVQWSAVLETNPGAATIKGTAQRLPSPQDVEAARWEGGVVTFLVPQHGLFVDDEITVEGMTPDGYNGTFTITDVDGDEINAALAEDPGSASELGTTRLRPSAAYGDANPAAVLYELMTNPVWGRGISPTCIDLPSFVQASQYFYDEGIGMSFTLESQSSLGDAIETIRAHVKLAVFWMGDKLYCQCLTDRSSAYSPRVVLTRDSIVDPEFSRPAWPNTYNEMRVQFLNRYQNYQSELAIAQDDANFATVGQINSTKAELPAFSSRESATRAAQQLLQDLSYPQATLKFKMARYHSGLYPSAFVELQWSEWSDGTVTTYWRVAEISDDDQGSAGLSVTLVEDLYSTPFVGVSEDFTPPVPAYEGMTRNSDAELYLGGDHARSPALTGLFFMVAEMSIKLTDSDKMFGFFCQRPDGYTHSVTVLWKAEDGEDFALLGTIKPWAIACVLQDEISEETNTVRRDQSTFRLQLRYASERAKFLEWASYISATSDGFERLTGSEKNWLIIGNEFIQIGQAEAGSGTNDVIVTAYVREQYGSERATHEAGTPCMFVYDFIPYAYTLRYDQMPLGVPITFRVYPQDRFGSRGSSVEFTHTFSDLARKALRVQNASGEVDGDDWVITYRPRWHDRGAEIVPDLTEMVNSITAEIPFGYEVRYQLLDTWGGELLAEPVLIAATFTPDDPEGMEPSDGMMTFTVESPDESAVKLVLYQTYNGVLGLPCEIQVLPDEGLIEDPDPPAPADGLFITLDASTLSGVTSVDETWEDQDTTEAQSNDAVIDWTYTPTPYSKPTLSTDHLTGALGGFPSIGACAITPVGIRDFDVDLDCTFGDAGTWADPSPSNHSTNLFRVELGGIARITVGFTGYGTGTLRLWFQANLIATPFANAAQDIAISKNVRGRYGIRVNNASAGAFDITFLIDGVETGSPWACNFDLDEVTLARLTFTGGSIGFKAVPFKVYGFNLETTS
jgi:hypothetical protein